MIVPLPNRGQRWTKEDEQYVIDHYKRNGGWNVSRTLGRTCKAVAEKAAELRKAGRMAYNNN